MLYLKEIEDEKKFLEIVDNIGAHLKLPEKRITLIKNAAYTKGSTNRAMEFKCAMNMETEGGGFVRYQYHIKHNQILSSNVIRLHTGSYSVSKNEKTFNFDIALAYMEMSNVTFRRMPVCF